MSLSPRLTSRLQAVLLKRECLDITARHQPGPPAQDTAVKAAYQAAGLYHAQADSNPWLQDQFTSKQITEVWGINTATLGDAAQKGLKQLCQAGHINKQDTDLLRERLFCLTYIRRNVDIHINNKVQVSGTIGKDLSDVYIPMLNQLSQLWHASS